MIPRVPIRKALTDPSLLGHVLEGDSWRAWRVLLTAAMGEPLEPDELAVFKQLTGREQSPSERVSELVAVVGRRGGKTRAMATLAAYIGCLCDHPALVPGETGVVLLIAPDMAQAAVALDYAAAAIEGSPVLAQTIAGRTSDTLTLEGGIGIVVRSANFRRLRGYTGVAVIGDESAFWLGEDRSTNPDTEIIGAVGPMLATTQGMLALISSPHAKRGVLYEAWKKHFGPDGDPRVLVAHAGSRDLNPSLPQSIIDRALEKDPEWARAEYLAQWRDDLESFVSRETVERCVESGIAERPFLREFTYHAFLDAAGGSGSDSMALAIGHREGERVVIDATREVKPPFSPKEVTGDFCRLLDGYRISTVRADAYAGQWVGDAFRDNGVRVMPAELTKSQIYGDFLPLMNTGLVVLPDNPRAVNQIASLERRTRFGGRGVDSIDHPRGAHDDLANVVAGVCVHARQQRGRASNMFDGAGRPRQTAALSAWDILAEPGQQVHPGHRPGRYGSNGGFDVVA